MKKSKFTPEERVLQQLINDYKISETNSIKVNRDNARELNMSEQEVMKHLKFLCDATLITINRRFSIYDLSMFWEISLTPNGLCYFENQKQLKKDKRNNWIQFWIPVSLSAIAIIISIIALILEL